MVCRNPCDLLEQELKGILCTISQSQKNADLVPENSTLSKAVSEMIDEASEIQSLIYNTD